MGDTGEEEKIIIKPYALEESKLQEEEEEDEEEEEIVETKKKLSRADLKSSVKVDFGKLLPTTCDKPTRRKRKEKVEEESPIFPDVTEKQETPEESESER